MLKTLKRVASKLHKKWNLIVFYGQRLTFSKTNESKTIVICFDGVFSHGGMVDRIKGIVSFFEIAKQLNYDFKISFVHPFNFSVYFEPNNYNWKLENKILYNPFDTEVMYLMNNFDCNPIELVRKSKANTILVYCNVDYLKKIIPEGEHAEKWRSHFNILFKKSKFLEQKLDMLPNENHIVFHTRFTSLMGDFKDSSIKIISEIDKQQLLLTLVKKINQKVSLFPNSPVYVLSDSIIFLDYIKKHTDFKVLEGSPIHLDFNNNSSLDSHTKTLTDFFFIASSDNVYLLKENKMYMSEFSKYAAIVGNKPFDVIL